MKFVVLLKKSTLHALSEHAVTEMGPVVEINENEALVMLSAEVITRLITLARPEDERIDDVITRLAH
ncbi:MAG: hypothetical protein KJZ69_17905 [Phycisphaerales bacterium]|nr:hypothetical protein [Phycisphaerales bacterium]